MKALLLRWKTGDQGTFGVIVCGGGQHLFTGELPWKNNQPNISCIPAGTYTVRVRVSNRFGRVYEITGVDGRTYILFHQGNFSGDRELGFRSNVAGCVLLGLRRGKLLGQEAVLNSRLARRRFEISMDFQPFELEVRNVGYSE